jgi:hypothetical protein
LKSAITMGKCGRTGTRIIHQRLWLNRTFVAWWNRCVALCIDWFEFNQKTAYNRL